MTMVGRREFVRWTAVGTAAMALPVVTAPAARAVDASAGVTEADAAVHLARRATCGPTPATVDRIRSIGRAAWLTEQLAPARIDDSACSSLMAQRFPGLGWTITQARAKSVPFSWDLMRQVGVAQIVRQTWSRRQLFEVMVDFWQNVLHVTCPSDRVWDNRQDYDRVVIRRHALGRFDQMLQASARHPAMLLYLNNDQNTRAEPNENYGRELLELHTVGVNAGYSEPEMLDSAHIMSGFGVDEQTGLFRFSAADHYRGSVHVLGFSHANSTGAGGQDVATAYLQYLAHHPATARRIATRLCERLVSDTPPPTLVDRLARVYRAQGTAIVPVLRELFASPEFSAATGCKVRRPLEDQVATLRLLGYRPDATGTDGLVGLYWMSGDLGHPPLGWPQPDGFPDVADAWASAGGTLARWNMHLSLAGHWWPDTLRQPPLRSLLPAKLPVTYGGFVDALSRRLLFRELPAAHRRAVLTFVGKTATDVLHDTDSAVGWRLPYVVALILDSPYHAVR